MYRVTIPGAGLEASVNDGRWSGTKFLADLGQALQPAGGISAGYPDPDYERALALSREVGGVVVGEVLVDDPPDEDLAVE